MVDYDVIYEDLKDCVEANGDPSILMVFTAFCVDWRMRGCINANGDPEYVVEIYFRGHHYVGGDPLLNLAILNCVRGILKDMG